MEMFDEDKLPDDEIGQLVGQLADRIESQHYLASAWPARRAPKRVRPWVAIVTTTAAAMIICTWMWTLPETPSWPRASIGHYVPVPGANSPSPQAVPLAADMELPPASLDPCLLGAPSADLAAAAMPGALGDGDLTLPAKGPGKPGGR